MANPQVTQPNNIPASAGAAPPGMVPTFGGAGIFTGYAPAPQGSTNTNVGGQNKTLPPVATQPATPVAPTTQPTQQPKTSAPTPATPPVTPPATPPATPPVTPPTGENYFVNTTDAKGNTITQYYDANGNPLSQNPGGTLTQLPSPPAEGQPVQTPSALNVGIQEQGTQLKNQLDTLNSQSDSAFSQYENQIAQIQNGTFPLTPAQQNLYQSTQQQFDVLRQQQAIANQALVQGMQVSEARSGEAVGGAQTALGNVAAAVNTGLQKLSALDAQGAKALADLQSGFQKDNLALVQDAYQAFQTYQTNKEKTINDIYTATVNAEKDIRDFTYKQTQDNITNTLNNEKFTYQQKQDAIDNALKQAQLDETKRAALVNEAQNAEKIKLQYAANQMLMGAYTNAQTQGVSQTLPDGNPNPVYQDKFLSSYSPDMQALIKGIANYTISPTSISAYSRGTGLTQGMVLAIVQQYDPTYNQQEYAARQKFLTGWKAGGQNSVIVAANTSVDHLTKLYAQAKNLNNLPSGALGPFTGQGNAINAWLSTGSQDPNINQFKQTAVALAGEMARIYKNGIGSSAAPTDDEIAQQLSIMTTNISPQNAKGLIQNGINLMIDRLTSSVENYQSVMGKTPDSILTPTALQNIQALNQDGFNIDISKLQPSQYSGVSNADFMQNFSTGNSSTPAMTNDPASFFAAFQQNANNSATQ